MAANTMPTDQVNLTNPL